MENNKMQLIIDQLRENKETIAVAESISCGRLSSAILACKQLHDVVKGTIVLYQFEAHKDILKLSPNLFKEYGLISRETSIEMALSIKKMLNSHVSIGVSGNLTAERMHNKDSGVVYFTIAYGESITNYSIKIDTNSTRVAYDISTKQIIDELYKIVVGE